MLLVDAFLYDGDAVVAERLRMMSPYVDYFYVVEACHSFSGKRKEVLYSDTQEAATVFEPYRDKVRFVIIPEFPPLPMEWVRHKIAITSTYNEDFSSWWREAYQRSFVLDRIRKDLDGQEYILISADVDEILSPHLLRTLKHDYKAAHPAIASEPVFLTMYFYYYSWKWMKPEMWTRPFIIHSMVLEGLFQQTYSRTLLNDIRMEIPKVHTIPNSGWHLSYFMDADAIARKIGNFSHTSLDQDRFKVREWVQRCIDEGLDVFQRPTENCIPAKNISYYMPDDGSA